MMMKDNWIMMSEIKKHQKEVYKDLVKKMI